MKLRLLLVISAISIFGSSCDDDVVNGLQNNPPQLSAIASQTMTVGETKEVGISATDADGDAVSFSVQPNPGFLSLQGAAQTGNTTTATCVMAPTEAHIGTFTGTIRVTDGRGGEDSRDFSIQVGPAAPEPEPGPWSGIAGFGELAFTVNAQGTAITEIGFTFQGWQCGAGTRNGTITSSTPSGWPISDGEFTIENSFSLIELTMTVHGRFSASDTASGSWTGVSNGTTCSGDWGAGRVVVPNQLPTAVIDKPGQDTTVTLSSAVDFQGTATDSDGTIVSHSWDFGDGNGSSVEDPGAYNYAAAGTYTVTYQVTDDDGAVSVPAELVVTVVTVPVDPAPGNWSGTAEFGELAFTVNVDRTAITEIGFTFQDWQCGGATRNGTITSSNPSGWPISDGEFTIVSSFADELTMTVQGTFSSTFAASGTWTGVSYGTTCSGDWLASSYAPMLSVFMSADFSETTAIGGFHWQAAGQVTLEIDNGADGSIDFQSTKTTYPEGVVWFHPEGPSPFTVAEGDIVRMYDAATVRTYVALYVTVESVDADADMVSGFAREGTELAVMIFDPALPGTEGPEIRLTADATEIWSADFAGIFDIVPGSHGWVIASVSGGGGHTTIEW
jgi:PKD repeat protein